MIKGKIHVDNRNSHATLEVIREYSYRGERRYMVHDEVSGKTYPTPADPFDAKYKGPGGKISKRSKGKPITKKKFKANELAHVFR